MNKKEWTIMLYMAGDNNLAVNMAYAMGQLKEFAGESSEKLNLFVYYDGNSPVTPTLYCDFSGKEPEYYRSHMIADKPFKARGNTINENDANKRAILNFVDWCVNKRQGRAERYAFILSGHSLGFLDKGLFRDETSNKSLKLWDLMVTIYRMTMDEETLSELKLGKRNIKTFLFDENANVILGQKLDILGFDSCVMGMFEVGGQFYDCAETMIVSEGSIPSAGWSYAKLLRGFCHEKAGCRTDVLVKDIVEEYIKSQSEFVIGGISVDMAAWRMERFIPLMKLMGKLSGALLKCFKAGGTLHSQMERALLKVHWKCQSYMYDQNVDLGDFCELLYQECVAIQMEVPGCDPAGFLEDLKRSCRDITEELQQVVIQSGFSGGSYQYSNGISIFFPWSLESYEAAEKNYQTLVTTKALKQMREVDKALASWGKFLKTYLRDVSRRKSKIRKSAPIKYSDLLNVGSQDSKIAGSQDSKIAGSQDSKIAGSQDSKIAGSQDSKIAGSQDSKIAGSQDSKMGGGGSNLLFDSLRLWKNIEAHQDIYGFTRESEEEA